MTALTSGDHGVPGQIGTYRILAPLGEGGLGTVYLAEQAAPMRRQVALKVIKWGMDTREVVLRFEAERQALALMNHPNVATVYDGGATDLGRPYFVMEYVPGSPITRYCDEHRLTMAERLALFMQVCHAVQHAHQKGIIHRDLKPSNVLVTLLDDRPVPKVIDFGIAKAIDQRLTEQTVATQQGQFIGTPEYMSPEQAGAASVDIDTRTDVYSLGVLLYELLIGTLPFDPEVLHQASYAELQRIIRDVEPLKPSTRLSRLPRSAPTASSASASPTRTAATDATESDAGASPPPTFVRDLGSWGRAQPTAGAVAANRRTDLRVLLRELRDGLDWVVMKALEKDRTRRYASASELAGDIVRHLNHEPVTAGPPNVRYRLGKFVRRNRALLGATAAIVLALLAGLAVATVGFVRASQERDRAEEAAARAEAVSTFLRDTLAAADPARLGRDARIVDVLVQAEQKLNQAELAEHPALEADARTVLGKTYLGLGLHSEASRNLERAWELLALRSGTDHPDTAAAETNVAEMLRVRSEHTRAREHIEHSVAVLRGAASPDRTHLIDALNVRGAICAMQCELETAEQSFEEALTLLHRQQGEDSEQAILCISGFGTVAYFRSQLELAATRMEEALAISLRVCGELHPHTITLLQNLAEIRGKLGDAPRAIAEYEDVIAVARNRYGDEHPGLAEILDYFGVLASGTNPARAEKALNEALKIRQKRLGEDHIQTATTCWNLGILLGNQRRFADCVPLFRAALPVFMAEHGLGDWTTRAMIYNQCTALVATDRAAEGEPLARQLLEYCRTAPELGDAELLDAVECLATMLVQQHQDTDELEQLQREDVELSGRVRGTDEELTLRAASRLAGTLARRGQPEEAARVYGDAARRAREYHPDSRELVAPLWHSQIRCLFRAQCWPEMEAELMEYHRVLGERWGASDPDVRIAVRDFVELYEAWGRPEQAAEWRAKLAEVEAATQPATVPAPEDGASDAGASP